MKILLAIPTYETIRPETFKSIYDMDKCGHEVIFEFITGYDCAKARNAIARRAIELKTDYFFMVDSDMIVPKDALKNLLDGDSAITLGLCPRKNTKKKEIEIYYTGQFSFVEKYYYDKLPDVKRIDIKGGGMACALIKTEILQKMQYPYFRFVEYSDTSALSEDLYFCLMAEQLGMKIQADTRVRCGHMAKYFQYE